MTSPLDSSSRGPAHQPNLPETPNLESQFIGLMISTNIHPLQREDGLHGSKFIECMDYSISSFETDFCSKQVSNKFLLPLSALVSSSTSSTLAVSRPNSRGLVGFVRKLSLATSRKRDPRLNPTATPLQMSPESFSSNPAKSFSLSRKLSGKRRRPSGLSIETTKSTLWNTGLTKQTFTPSFTHSSTNSPLTCLSSSTSGSSTDSRAQSRKSSKSIIAENGLAQSMVERSSSTTQIHLLTCSPPTHLMGSKTMNNDNDQSFEVLNRSSFSGQLVHSRQQEKIKSLNQTSPNPLAIFSKSTIATKNLEEKTSSTRFNLN